MFIILILTQSPAYENFIIWSNEQAGDISRMKNVKNIDSVALVKEHLHDTQGHIHKLCKPLFSNTPIDFFDYLYFYCSGQMVKLSSSSAIAAEFYSSRLLPTHQDLQWLKEMRLKYTLLSSEFALPSIDDRINPEKFKKNIELCVNNNTHHRVYFIKEHEGNFCVYGFGSSNQDKSLIGYLLTSIQMLERFVEYFEVEAHDLLGECHRERRIDWPSYHQVIHHSKQVLDNPFGYPEELENFFSKQSSSNIILPNKKIVKLTMRERECLDLMAGGYTMKMIGRELNISPRTAENHLRNIKEKIGLTTKAELIKCLQLQKQVV